MGFLPHDKKREQLVSTSMFFPEATYNFSNLKPNTWLDMIKNGPADDFAKAVFTLWQK